MAMTKRLRVSFNVTARIGSIAEEHFINVLREMVQDIKNLDSHRRCILELALNKGPVAAMEFALKDDIRSLIKKELHEHSEADGDLLYRCSPAQVSVIR